ncbi:MAG: DUF2460 domain-containing protein [Pseudomonadota bacterium]
MSQDQSFHEVRFPTDLALGATGGPERRTEVLTLGSGREQRNSQWAHSRRRFNAGYGIKTLEDLQSVIEFFEERRGRLYGFRFRDPMDWKSAKGNGQVTAFDQIIATGDGSSRVFQLVKQYGSVSTGYQRQIVKPVNGTVKVSVNGSEVSANYFSTNSQTGRLTFIQNAAPPSGQVIQAGYEFDVPVRFDADEIAINLTHFEAGDIPSIPIVELLI